MDVYSVRAKLALVVDQLARPNVSPDDLVDLIDQLDVARRDLDELIVASVALEDARLVA